jgi:hypothetical protein
MEQLTSVESPKPFAPLGDETPVQFADRLGQMYVRRTTPAFRKAQGLYFTPVEIARYMATMVEIGSQSGQIKILDPAASNHRIRPKTTSMC